ncbi:hypothetical protein [Arenibacter sp. ARW7G5Y1]|uniref:hypothetical protein n=1 Tax=Arenibacter sp. ARW7G5Y1 TaxID=2135619 RepID=UPI000D76E26D|nr:hypothetical protein [Arenibacter sp. ARW7G5Y1]PXX30537.1 hypothetical protein C7972_102161 [Arenibacter sp. ARW7G5Y1]
MKLKKINIFIGLALFLTFFNTITAQIPANVYHFEEKNKDGTLHHELKLDADYYVHTIYKESPAEFIKTMGGYYSTSGNKLMVDLEFNSNHKEDKITSINIPYRLQKGKLILQGTKPMTFTPTKLGTQDLDGKWLMTGRVTEQGEQRRDTSRPRKTMKYLLNGHFQWIAYNTETFEFFGSGGGTYNATNGKYIENINYFSRDNSRVGAALSFNYELNGKDWHHTGKSSKGDPLNEIWTKRE